jgi:hypothetical protein
MPDVQVPKKKGRGRPSRTKGIKQGAVNPALILDASRRSSASISSRSSSSSTASLVLSETRRAAGGLGGRIGGGVVAGGRGRHRHVEKTTVAGVASGEARKAIKVGDLLAKIEELKKSNGLLEDRAVRQRLVIPRTTKQARLLHSDLQAKCNAIRQYSLNNSRRAAQPTGFEEDVGVNRCCTTADAAGYGLERAWRFRFQGANVEAAFALLCYGYGQRDALRRPRRRRGRRQYRRALC